MQNDLKIKYSVIIPAHNEERFIAQNLQSIVNQTYLPSELIIVNDNSTDRTEMIAQGFSLNYPYIRIINSGNLNTSHEPGSKIIQAFYKGYQHINADWDVIVKLDADVVLPENYFEEIMRVFQNSPKTGIAGGLAYIEKKKQWIYEKIGNKKQVRGPFKSYSRACFEKIGGLKKSIGWDTVDELLAKYYGFEIMVIPDLQVRLLKPTGNDYKKIHGERTGNSFYKMDYGWIISSIAAVKAAWNARSLNLFFAITKGYWKLVLNNDPKIVTKEEGKFIRAYRWRKILNRFVNHS